MESSDLVVSRIRKTSLGLGVMVVLLTMPILGCTQPLPPPTPEGPAVLSTVRAYMSATAAALRQPTPERPSLVATLQAQIPLTVQALLSTPTPEAPAIMSTVNHLLATPTSTPLPTNTPGPTPTPRARESASATILHSTVRVLPIRLEVGERIEGYYQGSSGMSSFSIQDPNGNTVRDYGATQGTNFQVIADVPGLYSLVFQSRRATGLEPGNISFSYSYSFEVYGR
jgi:hypothetical protein